MADYSITLTGPHRYGQTDTLTVLPLNISIEGGHQVFDGSKNFTPHGTNCIFDPTSFNPSDGATSFTISVTYTLPGPVSITMTNDGALVNPSAATATIALVLPAVTDVRLGVDRGDGTLGTALIPTAPTAGTANLQVFCVTGTGTPMANAIVEHRAAGTSTAGFALPGTWQQAPATGVDGVATCQVHAGERWAFRVDAGAPQFIPAGYVSDGQTKTAPFSLRGHPQS